MQITSSLFSHLVLRMGVARTVFKVEKFPVGYIKDQKIPTFRDCLTNIPVSSTSSKDHSQHVSQPTQLPTSFLVPHLNHKQTTKNLYKSKKILYETETPKKGRGKRNLEEQSLCRGTKLFKSKTKIYNILIR